ncbi:uncharacterized protein LOC123260448 [Cotesia glomerata]|uniref:Uncharacterized protein n=1 Tax=Cotesia glomerata TaxID=32391 RepID=A0AAV7IAZ9_COTGL|nr:uncharacterized protein LOC123260448 [Cotesia glomerata]KAH0548833.1 hypothetical protein KQX54_003029 [Cotesia glomerata]
MNVLLICLIVIVVPTIQIFGNPLPQKNETLASYPLIKDPMKRQMSNLIGDLVLVVNILSQARKVNVEAAVKTISDVVNRHLEIMTHNLTSYHQYQPTTFDDTPSYSFTTNSFVTPPITVNKTEAPQKFETDLDFILQGSKLENAIATFLNYLQNSTLYSAPNMFEVASKDPSIKYSKIG